MLLSGRKNNMATMPTLSATIAQYFAETLKAVWVFEGCANEGNDTIAFLKAGMNVVSCEIDHVPYAKLVKRVEGLSAQTYLTDFQDVPARFSITHHYYDLPWGLNHDRYSQLKDWIMRLVGEMVTGAIYVFKTPKVLKISSSTDYSVYTSDLGTFNLIRVEKVELEYINRMDRKFDSFLEPCQWPVKGVLKCAMMLEYVLSFKPSSVIYIGAGPGASLSYVAARHPEITFHAYDPICRYDQPENVTWHLELASMGTVFPPADFFVSDIRLSDENSFPLQHALFTASRCTVGVLKVNIEYGASEMLVPADFEESLFIPPFSKITSSECRVSMFQNAEMKMVNTYNFERFVWSEISKQRSECKFVGDNCGDCKLGREICPYFGEIIANKLFKPQIGGSGSRPRVYVDSLSKKRFEFSVYMSILRRILIKMQISTFSRKKKIRALNLGSGNGNDPWIWEELKVRHVDIDDHKLAELTTRHERELGIKPLVLNRDFMCMALDAPLIFAFNSLNHVDINEFRAKIEARPTSTFTGIYLNFDRANASTQSLFQIHEVSSTHYRFVNDKYDHFERKMDDRWPSVGMGVYKPSAFRPWIEGRHTFTYLSEILSEIDSYTVVISESRNSAETLLSKIPVVQRRVGGQKKNRKQK